jgi:2-dehydro-3-deoxygluconokinase
MEESAEMASAVMQAAGVSETVLPSYKDEAAWFGDADLGAALDSIH